MKTSSVFRLAAALSLAAAGLSAHAAVDNRLLGTPAPADSASRTVVVAPGTSHVDVQYREVVRFESNGQSFAVRFDGVRRSFDLNALAPAGALPGPVKVYVSPRYEDDLH